MTVHRPLPDAAPLRRRKLAAAAPTGFKLTLPVPALPRAASPAATNLLVRQVPEVGWQIRSIVRARCAEASGLREGELRILMILGEMEVTGPAELARRLDRDKSQICRQIKALQALGVVGSHRRHAPLLLTPAAEMLHERLRPVIAECHRHLLRGIAQTRQEESRQALAALRDLVRPADVIDAASDRGSLIEALALAGRAIRKSDRLATPDLALTSLEAAILARVAEHPAITLSRLAELTGRDKGQLCRLLATLADSGLIDAEPLSSRQKLVRPTRHGWRFYDRIQAGWAELESECPSALAPDQRRLLAEVLRQLAANAAALRDADQSFPSLH